MTVFALSAAQVQGRLLEPAMEATALNRLQQRLCFNPSPEIDSLAELLVVGLRDGAAPWELQAFALVRQLLAANASEGVHERAITGVLDPLARQLHAAELAGARPAGLPVKQLAAAVRGPLGVLQAETVAPLAAADAVRAIDQATAGCAREKLAAGSVRNALGPRKHDLLLELFDRGTRGGAA
ncbi:MAG TPA: hypothetical protein VFZ00_01500 [Solirubrobacter sp.]|nr:hypothetical protein [Solirubrobacter sp.]